jgi:hypothetical protein
MAKNSTENNSKTNDNGKLKENATNKINTNVDDYSIDELLIIFGISDDEPSASQINSRAVALNDNIKIKNDKSLIQFIENARALLVTHFSQEYIEEQDDLNNETTNLGTWYKNEYLKQTDANENLKTTKRKNQTKLWTENEHYQMKQNMLGITNSYTIPVLQDSLNPNMNNINTRIVNLDSQFRPNILPYDQYDPNSPSSATNYTIDLTDPLTNVISMRVYSVQIPKSWYKFSPDQGNTTLFLSTNGVSYKFNLPVGNYDPFTLVTQLNTNNNWTPSPHPFDWSFNSVTNKITFSNNHAVTFNIYDGSGTYNGGDSIACNNVYQLNNNLGWSLGIRPTFDRTTGVYSETFQPVHPVYNPINMLRAIIDVYGPKYFCIVLDDFNQNRTNKGLVSINENETSLSLPNYYSADLAVDCSNAESVQRPFVLPTIPSKNVTQAQLYSINQILQNRKAPKQRNYGTTSSDIIALLPLDINLTTTSSYTPYMVYGVNIAINERKYFGPVNISRMKVRLVDDKGNTVNLNGNDWSLSLIVNELYQY